MIQKSLIRYILSPLGGLMDTLSEKTRDFLFSAAGMGLILHYFLWNMSLVKYRFLIFFTVDCLFLGVLILSTLRKDIQPVSFRWPVAVCWFAVGMLMLVSGLVNNPDYLPEAVLLLVVYPVIFICWNQCDRTRIFGLLLRICKISLVLFVAGSFLLVPIGHRQYSGIFSNANGAAYFLAVCITCLLVELLYETQFGWKSLWNALLMGLAVAMMYYSNSRTGVLASIAALAGGGVVFAISHGGKENLKCLTRLLFAAAVSVVMVLSLVYVFQLRQHLHIPVSLDTQTGTFHTVQSNGSAKPDTAKPSEDEKVDLSQFNDYTSQKGSLENKTVDQFSTGRISVWKAYAKDLNWTGHAETPKVYIDIIKKEIASTHMTILQVAYESGIPAGIFYLLLNLTTGIGTILFAWRNRKERYAVMPLMITLAFGVMSVLGSCAVSLWYLPTLYYYFVQFPIIAKKRPLPAGEA